MKHLGLTVAALLLSLLSFATPGDITGTLAVCEGHTTTLYDDIPGGTWSISSAGTIASIDASSGIVTGIAPGTATVTYDDGVGVHNAIVTVNPQPAAITGVSGVLCIGSTGTLFCPGGGTWESSTAGIIALGTTTGVYTGLTAGTSTITYTLPTGCYVTLVVTVAAGPAISGATSFCLGGVTSLTSTAGTWSSSIPSVATVGATTGIVTGVSAGTTTITLTPPTGCGSITTVTVNPIPSAIVGSMVVCAGNSLTLMNATPGGTWSASGAAISIMSSTTGVYNGVAPGTAVVTYTLATGCYTTAVVTCNAVPAAITGSPTVCAGLSSTLADAMPGGTWSSSSPAIAVVNAAGVFTGISAGITMITYTLPTGCLTTITVTVNIAPNIVGPSSMCEGTTATFASAMPGGVWMSGSPGVATILSASGIATAVSPGPTTIFYALPVTGCTGSLNIVVNPAVPAITGTPTICPGGTTTLYNTAVGGTWVSSNTTIAYPDAVTGEVTGVSAGVTFISYFMSTGCYAVKTVTVNPSPGPITGTLSVCSGLTTTLHNFVAGGVWTSGTTSVATIDPATGVVSGLTAGTTNITYSGPCGGSSAAVVTVVTSTGAITGSSSICAGGTATFSNPTSGGTWSSSDGGVATVGAATGVVTAVGSGAATISYTAGTCGVATLPITIAPLPNVYLVTGSGAACSGSGGVTVGTDGSDMGVSYTLRRSSGIVVSTVAGTGTALSFGAVTVTDDYIVTAANDVTGCTRQMTGTAAVTINPTPAITGSSIACVGTTTTLTASVAGGTWTSGDLSHLTVTAGGIASGVIVGTANVTYVVAGGCSATAVVTVSLVPAAITGPTSLCIGTPATLACTPAGGTWTSSNPGIAVTGISSGIITASTPGSATISYTAPSGCWSTIVVTVNNFGITSSAGSICAASTFILYSIGSGIWSSSDPAIATVASGVVTGVAPGTVSIIYTGSACVSVRVMTVTSTCSGTPSAGTVSAVAVTCPGSYLTLYSMGATIGCGIGYQWQQSADATTWTNMAGATTTMRTFIPTTTRYYRMVATCASGGTSAESPAVYNAVGGAILSHSVVGTDTACDAGHFYVSSCASSLVSVTTYFGDATSATQPMTTGYTTFHHSYATSGTYTVKQVSSYSGVATDSVTFTYTYTGCKTLSFKLYKDNNGNCIKESTEPYNVVPIMVRVDSGSTPVDTLSVTGGFYYNAFAPAGTIYTFTLLPVAGSITPSCPSSGILTDTIPVSGPVAQKQFAINCSSTTSGYDLALTTSQTCGRHTQYTVINVSNYTCSAVSPVLTMTFSPKYSYMAGTYSSYMTSPLPTSVVGNTLTWNLSSLATGSSTITVYLERPGGSAMWLLPGDTVNTMISVSPTSGDVNTSNNVVIRVDTVVSSFDPNDIAVIPQGNILPCTQLQYKVRFENTGNAIAENIYVLDTLPAYLDMTSLQVVSTSHEMDVNYYTAGGYNIARFDFPNINLLDTSHHYGADGMFVFNIKAKSAVPDGVAISNRAGIYFDDNPAVMTNTVTNMVGLGPITGSNTMCIGTPATLQNSMIGGTWAASNPHATVAAGVVTGVSIGADTISYTVSNTCTTRTVTKVVTINSLPSVTPIVGLSDVCVGAIITLADLTSAGIWSSTASGVASIDVSGHVSGLTAGTTTMSYSVYGTCGIGAATSVITVHPIVTPAIALTGPSSAVCSATPAVFSTAVTAGGSIPVYYWTVNGVSTGSGLPGYSYLATEGDLVRVRLTSNEMCRTADTAFSTWTVHVTESVMPEITSAATPAGTVCEGSTVDFAATTLYGGTAPAILWIKGTAVVGMGTTYSYIPANGDVIYCKLASDYTCRLADTVSSTSLTMSVAEAVVPAVVVTAVPGVSIVEGESVTFTATSTTPVTSPSYQWSLNATDIPGETNATYTSSALANGDVVSCKITAGDVCGLSSFNSVTMLVTPVGITTLNGNSKLTIAPNPGKGTFTVKGQIAASDGPVIMEVRNMLGQAIYSAKVPVKNNSVSATITLDEGLANGVYMLHVIATNSTDTYYFVIEK